VIGSYQSVGTLLVFGLLVGPPATAALLSRTVPQMMLISVVIALFSVLVWIRSARVLGAVTAATVAVEPETKDRREKEEECSMGGILAECRKENRKKRRMLSFNLK